MATAKKAKIVKAPLVIAYMPDGSHWSGYAGTPLPEGLREGEEQRLDDEGFLEDAPEPAKSEK